MARKFANYKIRRIEPVLKPTLRADSLRTDSSAQAARVSSKIEPKFSFGADSESLHLELSPSLPTIKHYNDFGLHYYNLGRHSYFGGICHL